jgi:hypothetical protein
MRGRHKTFKLNAGMKRYDDNGVYDLYVIRTHSVFYKMLNGCLVPALVLTFDDVYRVHRLYMSSECSLENLRTGHNYKIDRSQIRGYFDYIPNPNEPKVYIIKGRLAIGGTLWQNAQTCWIR